MYNVYCRYITYFIDMDVKLTKVEEEVMQMIWKQSEPVTVSQLIANLPEPKPPHSTISSIVRILEKKGFVSHKAYGKTHVYFPVIKRKEYIRSRVGKLISSYFEGSANDLVSFLVKEQNLSVRELSELIKKIEEE